jgi:hypothetical protein
MHPEQFIKEEAYWSSMNVVPQSHNIIPPPPPPPTVSCYSTGPPIHGALSLMPPAPTNLICDNCKKSNKCVCKYSETSYSPTESWQTAKSAWQPVSFTATVESAKVSQQASNADTGIDCAQRLAKPHELREHTSQKHRCKHINPTTGKPCDSNFSRPYDLTRHENTVHGKAKLRCAHCKENRLFRQDALMNHLRLKHPDKVPATTPPPETSSAVTRRGTKRLHNNSGLKKRFECTQKDCNKSYMTIYSLSRHQLNRTSYHYVTLAKTSSNQPADGKF